MQPILGDLANPSNIRVDIHEIMQDIFKRYEWISFANNQSQVATNQA